MGKKDKKEQSGKPKKLTPKDIGKRLDALAKKLGEELEGADLFAPLPPTEDCAICFVPLSHVLSGTLYRACCGNAICLACYRENEDSIIKQNRKKNAGKKLALACPFCREPDPTCGDEAVRQLQARCLKNDHNALRNLGDAYQDGKYEVAKDDLKALDCYIRAVELGSAEACGYIGNCYTEGNGVAVNKERAALFERVGALRGDVVARHNIGLSEYELGNNEEIAIEIAIRHWKIAAETGYQDSLNKLRDIYNLDGKRPGREFISKDYLESIYRACHGAQLEVKSEERDKHSIDESKKYKY